MKRVLGALFAVLFAWLGVMHPAHAVARPTPSIQTTDAYDTPVYVHPTNELASERGPPGATCDHTINRAVGFQPHGQLARPSGVASREIYAYDSTPSFVQVDNIAVVKGGAARAGIGDPSSFPAMQEAANTVRSAAPSTFTRAEALSGRASQRTVNEIAESMRANGWQGAPIDVVELNGQRIVVDGHHRLAAARRAGIDVQYQVVDPSAVIGPGKYTSIDDILQSTYSVGRDRLR